MKTTPSFTRVITDPAVRQYLTITPARDLPWKRVSAVATGGLALSRTIVDRGHRPLEEKFWGHVALDRLPETGLTVAAQAVAKTAAAINKPAVAAAGA